METRLPVPILSNSQKGSIRTEAKLLLWVFSGVTAGTGVALLALLVANWQTAVVVAGGCLIATALSLVHYLHRIDKPSVKAVLQNASLVRHMSMLSDNILAVTSLEGDILSSNDRFDQLVQNKLWNICELAENEDEKLEWHGLLESAASAGHAEQRFSIAAAGYSDFLIEVLKIEGVFVFTLVPQSTEDVLKRASNALSPAIEVWLEKTGQVIFITDKTSAITSVIGAISAWLGDSYSNQKLSALSLSNNQTRLLFTDGEKPQKAVEIVSTRVPIRAGDGDEIVGYTVFARQREKVQRRLNIVDASAVIDPVFDEAPVAVGIVSDDGTIKELNATLKSHPAATDLAEGRSILTLVAEEDRDEVSKLIARAFQDDKAAPPLDVRFNVHPQRVGQISVSTVDTGENLYVVLYISDMTQEKSLERQFVQAQKMQAVGQLAGGVAHDFNNLLTAIIGFCDLLLVRHDAGDQSFSDIIQIKQNANRAANLVRQLLAFSRQQTLRPKILSMTDILAELSNLLRRLIGEKINLTVLHGRELKPVKADQGQLEQVIINLAVNARDAMQESGELTIRTSLIGPDHDIVSRYDIVVPDEYVMIEVIDNGCGIPKDDLGKIFEPFFTTKEVGQGTGLGLATVYGIVKQTGGYVFAVSEVGVGTTFHVLLKAHQPSDDDEVGDTAPLSDMPVRDLTGKGTILIVEDEDPVRMFASRALSNKGYTVLEAASGEQGLEVLKSHDGVIDLLISDVVMPQMDGPALVAAARQEMPDLPVIFVSGYAEDMVRKDLEDEEFNFLPKPFSLTELAETVKTILD